VIRGMRVRAVLAAALLTMCAAPGAAAQERRPFVPQPASDEVYDVAEPPGLPGSGQQVFVRADDGVRLYTETYLPKKRAGGPARPSRLPALMMMTPYQGTEPFGVAAGSPSAARTYTRNLAIYFARRGYAFTVAHMRGTGSSGGCFDYTGPLERADGARLVDFIGREAPWASGRVGLFGGSTPGTAALGAATSGDPRIEPLRAVVLSIPIPSQYAVWNGDGVPDTIALANWPGNVANDALPHPDDAGQEDPKALAFALAQRPGCAGEVMAPENYDGDYTPWYEQREHRSRAHRIRAATLLHGALHDPGVYPVAFQGFFERLPRTTPRMAIFGQWGHMHPDFDTADPDAPPGPGRGDWRAIVTAWFDRHVAGLPAKTSHWPAVQVQDNEGVWHTERGFPETTGTPGRLALGGGCDLGARQPTGVTAFNDASVTVAPPVCTGAGAAVFETPALTKALRITGTPVLDLWVGLDKPDAHVAATLEAVDAEGHSVYSAPIEGRRSAQHLDPLVDGRFEQRAAQQAPVGRAVNIPVRMTPVDLVVPPGGRLRLTVAGACVGTLCPLFSGGTQPSGSATQVSILHDCAGPVSALRFTMPPPDRPELDVQPLPGPAGPGLPLPDPPAPAEPSPAEQVDGGGIATAPIC
jgi:X-Pro dipeptidyl-peptidase